MAAHRGPFHYVQRMHSLNGIFSRLISTACHSELSSRCCQFAFTKQGKLQPKNQNCCFGTNNFHKLNRCLQMSAEHTNYLSKFRNNISSSKRTFTPHESRMSRAASSAVYVPPDGDTVRVVEVDLDLENRLQNLRNLAENLAERNLDVKIFYLVRDYKVLQKLAAKKQELDQEKEDIAHQMSVLVKQKNVTPEQKDRKAKLICRGKEIRESLREIQKQYNTQEEKVMERALKLPAEIHPHTPKYDQVIMEVGDKPYFDFRVKSFTEIGQNNKWLSLSIPVSPGAYYLSGEFAELEQALVSYMTEEFLTADLKQLSCPDMFKSVVVEGCGLDLKNPDKVYSIMQKASEITSQKEKHREDSQVKNQSNIYHLTGVGSVSFAGYLMRMNISQKSLPLKYFATGRHYTPADKSQSDSITPFPQTTRVELFAATAGLEQCEEVFEEYQSLLLEAYKKLEIRTRLVKMSCSSLRKQESARVDVIVWSPSFSRYFKVAEVSMCGDYISRRLMIKHAKQKTDIQNSSYVHTIHGYALSVPDLMACIVENKQTRDGKFLWPGCLKDFRLAEI